LVGPIFKNLTTNHPSLERGRLIGEAVRRLISQMVGDVAETTSRGLAARRPQTAADVRRDGRALAEFSPGLLSELTELKDFLFRRMYHHPRVVEVMQNAQLALTQLFGAFVADPSLLPQDWMESCGPLSDKVTARAVCDYIAGMTDRFALQEHRRILHIEIPI
jgi:dGTPase